MGKKERFYADVMAMHPEVTGSCNLVIVKLPNDETIRFVVDCGLFQETEYDELNSTLPFNAENVDFCLVTHNHVDHTGRLPFMATKSMSRSLSMAMMLSASINCAFVTTAHSMFSLLARSMTYASGLLAMMNETSAPLSDLLR